MADNNPDPNTDDVKKQPLSGWVLIVLLLLAFVIILVFLAFAAVIYWRNMSDSRNFREVEELIGTTLPDDASDLKIHRWEPGADLALYNVYIRFETSQEGFTDLMGRMKMDFHNSGGDALMFLPAAWGTEPEILLEWWEAKADTPDKSAATAYGTNGWIVAKYEEGAVYMIVTDSDFFE